MQDLGSCGAARVGSTPTFRIDFYTFIKVIVTAYRSRNNYNTIKTTNT